MLLDDVFRRSQSGVIRNVLIDMNSAHITFCERPRRVFNAACLALAIACSRGLAVEHAPAQRVVSLGPSLTKQLYLLGVANRVVGITTYCPQPVGLPGVDRIGSVVDPNVETIVRLRPDLILTTPLTNGRRVAALRALRMPLVEFPAARTFNEICEQFLELGKQVGGEQQAESIVRRAKAEASILRETVSKLDRPSVFIQIGAKPLCTAGPDSFLNDLVEMAGAVNIAREAKVRTYSREAVLAANPDCILIVTMGLTGPDEKQKWSQYDNLAAASNGRIHMIDSELVCSPTPASFVEALDLVANLLHPQTTAGAGSQPGAKGGSRE